MVSLRLWCCGRARSIERWWGRLVWSAPVLVWPGCETGYDWADRPHLVTGLPPAVLWPGRSVGLSFDPSPSSPPAHPPPPPPALAEVFCVRTQRLTSSTACEHHRARVRGPGCDPRAPPTHPMGELVDPPSPRTRRGSSGHRTSPHPAIRDQPHALPPHSAARHALPPDGRLSAHAETGSASVPASIPQGQPRPVAPAPSPRPHSPLLPCARPHAWSSTSAVRPLAVGSCRYGEAPSSPRSPHLRVRC